MKVLIATYGGAHVAVALPLYRELSARGHGITLLALTTAGPVCRQAGIPHRRPIDYARLDDPDVQQNGRQLAAVHHTDGIGLSWEESIAYLGESYGDLVEAAGPEEAERRYRAEGLKAFRPVRFLKRIIAREAPDMIVATDSPRMERAAMNAAFELAVPSVCVVCIFPHIGMHFLRRHDNGDFLCVCNDRVRRQLIEAGRRPESVVVTGNPAWDVLAEPDGPSRRAQARAAQNLRDRDVVVLWAEQPEPDHEELPRRIREELGRLCRAEPGWKLLVRLHPSSTDARGEKMPAEALVSPRTEPLLTALHLADVVITMTSTVGYEALLLDKPVIILEMSQYSHTVDYSPTEGALVLSSLEDVGDAIRTLTTGTPQAELLSQNRKKLPRPADGARRVADQIERTAAIRKAGWLPGPSVVTR